MIGKYYKLILEKIWLEFKKNYHVYIICELKEKTKLKFFIEALLSKINFFNGQQKKVLIM